MQREEREKDENLSTQEKLFRMFMKMGSFTSRGHGRGGMEKPAQIRVLKLLSKNEDGVSQQELLETLDVRASSLSELLGKLEANELIVRMKDEDNKRSVHTKISEKGKEFLEQGKSKRNEKVEKMFAALSNDEQEQLTILLEKLFVSWKEERQEHCKRGEHEEHEGHGCRGKHMHGHGGHKHHKDRESK